MRTIIFISGLTMGFVFGVYASKKQIKINFSFQTEDR